MKRLPALLLAMVLVACGTRPQQPAAHPDWSYNSVVYEMNVRQYTPEGTLAAAARHLPRLRELGVDVVWLMPVYPIGVKERKGTLGSYYAISDYEAVNPEFGTLEDFDRFLAEAHRLGLRVILDWVASVLQLKQNIQKAVNGVGIIAALGGQQLNAVEGTVDDTVPVQHQKIHESPPKNRAVAPVKRPGALCFLFYHSLI